MTEREASCPICRRRVAMPADNPAFPFCSSRCQLADLGSWLDERYRIPADDAEDSDRSDR